MPLARIGIGANLDDAVQTVRTALAALARYGEIARASSLYRSKPWGVTDQPDFINAAVLLETNLTPHELLASLKGLEEELGRTPTTRWGPRVIDLDILAYGDVTIDEPDLTIPHAQLHNRAFALVPLAEIDPAYEAARDALSKEERESVIKLAAGAL